MSTRIRVSLRRLLPQPLVGAGTVALAVLALAVAWFRAPLRIGGPQTVPVMLVALGLVSALVVANRFPIPIRRQQKIYMASVPVYLLAVLVPPPLAATAAGVGTLLGELVMRARRGNSAGTIASEVGRRALVVLLGALVAHLPAEGALHTVLWVGAALVLGAGDIITCPLVLAPLTGEPPLKIIVAAAQQASLMEGAQYLMGLLGVLAAAKQVWALALLALPTGLVYLSFWAIVQAEDAQQRAEQAARVRDAFLRAASHDLRTPLTVMLGHVERIRTELDTGRPVSAEWLYQHLTSIDSAGSRIVDHLQELTDTARLQMSEHLDLRMEPLDAGALVRDVVGSMEAGGPEGDARVVVEASDGVVIQGDRLRLERVMQNIIGNAIKYSPDGAPVQVTVGRHDQWTVICVRDQGVGIPHEELPHIFTPFYRASTARGIPGTGVGLAGSKMIVEQHGGQITVESAVGEGTSVVVRLPGPRD
ncbi:MAG TPA: HAMP domain-containing sensor histidine kinase [Chloroflexota bacterium]|nr:HAMP domain-containing sensor histidine kinase [Chloroflexota bacterium]